MTRRRSRIPLTLFWLALGSVSLARPPQVAGNLSIVLPPRLLAGQPATLAVLSPAGRLAPGIAVRLPDGTQVITDPTGRAGFRAPPVPGVLIAEIPGTDVRAVAAILAGNPAAPLHLSRAPRLVSLRDRFTVSGTGFGGDAEANRVQFAGRAALVLAASPLDLVLLPPAGISSGPAELRIASGGQSASARVTLLSIDFHLAGPARPKRKTRLTLRVRGTNEPVEIDIRNLSPDVIRFPRGQAQRLETKGGTDNSAGLEVKGLRSGEFSVDVRLAATPGPPDIEAAQQFLLACPRQAAPNRARSVEKLVRQLERPSPDVRKIRKEMERMLGREPAGDSALLLRAARDALLGRR